MQGQEPQITRKPQCLYIIKSPKFKASIWENNPKTKQQNHTLFLKETTKSTKPKLKPPNKQNKQNPRTSQHGAKGKMPSAEQP